MIEQTAIEPVRRSVKVRTSIEDAFRVFTEEIGAWWPMAIHSVAVDEREGEGVTPVSLRMEPRLGGRIIESMSDGKEADWATITAWDPPDRLMLEWNPSLTSKTSTEIEVRFTAEPDGRTLVALEHRGWERFGERATAAREGYAGGWNGVLDRYAAVAGSA